MNYFVTGLLCSGKSTFLAAARAHDFDTLNADELVANLYKDKTIIQKIQNEFDKYDLFRNTEEVIKILFFKSDANRKKIESIIHPEVHKIINEELVNKKNLIVEVPPLLSNYKLLKENKSIFIDTDIKNRTIRYLKRENLDLCDFWSTNNDFLRFVCRVDRFSLSCFWCPVFFPCNPFLVPAG